MSDLRVAPHDATDSLATGDPLLLHEYFARAVRRWPQHVAIEVPPGADRPERQQITYAELQRQVGLLTHALEPVVGAERVVAILLPRKSHLPFAAQLAVLQAGAAYTSLDGSWPDDHLAWVLADARAVAVVTDAAGRERLARLPGPLPLVVDVAEVTAGQRPGPTSPPAWLGPCSLAYVIYTSGTTGRPKGVLLEHRGIANLVGSDLTTYQLRPEDRVAQNSSHAYDSSVEETWLALAAGATLVVMDDETARLGPDLVGWLRRERITVLCPSPTQLRAMGCADPATLLPDLRFVYAGGEALPQDLSDRWSRGRWLENGYGPTECTVTVVRVRMVEDRPVVIGKPVRGHQAFVLDGRLEEVPDGQTGELCIAGVGLARGYLGQPELTAERFPVHPRLGRIYRTGDLAQRDPQGNLICLGRMDGQVKLRGYRIELAAIEARILECPGVLAAACRLQGEGADQMLVAFVVPTDAEAPPAAAGIRSALLRTLPEYMVPGRFAQIAALPTTVGGKLERRALPLLSAEETADRAPAAPPRDELEAAVAAAFAAQLGLPVPSIHADFFELGGNSLRAAELISRLRPDPRTAGLAVRDVYEARTVAGLAKRARAASAAAPRAEPEQRTGARPAARPVLATAVQTVWLLLGLIGVSNLLYAAAFVALPALVGWLGFAGFFLLSPVVGLAAVLLYGLVTVALAVLAKRILIGRYRPLRAPVWGGFFVRNWIVQRMVQLVPWWLIQGTVIQSAVLRALGARIGKRLHLSRGVDLLQGGWDLLQIGDDVSLGHDASLRLIELEDGHIVVGPVVLEDGCTVDVRAGMAPHTVLESGAFLATSSSLASHARVPRGARWDGVPAQPAGAAPAVPPLPAGERILSPSWHGVAMVLVHFAVAAAVFVPLLLLATLVAHVLEISPELLLQRLSQASSSRAAVALITGCVVAAVPITLLLQGLALRWSRPIPTGPVSRFGLAYIRATLKNAVVESAGNWLSGTLLWPVWLRLTGMAVGRKCEISTIMDVVPEHVAIGDESFLADGIYLGSPRVQRGTVTFAPTRLGRNTFLGNHVVVAAGQTLPDGVLLGVCTVADDRQARPATSWFGHPPFELPRREVVTIDRRLTHDPGPLRYATRVFWEALRFLLPVVPVWLFLSWLGWLDTGDAASGAWFLLGAVPAVTFAVSAAACLTVLALKWALLGRVRQGQHPLWSCWCSRWDFLYVAWSLYARRLLGTLEGTLLLSWYLRAMGARIGRRVVLGNGFAHVVDPDMLHFEDDATVHAMFQAHSFEDRVLKIDHVRIRHGATVGQAAVLLYGAEIGARCRVAAHSVVMKHERLLADQTYGGCPTRPLTPDLAT